MKSQQKKIRLVTIFADQKAHLVKKGDGEFLMQPNERETLTMVVQPEEYMPKTVEHCQFMNRFLARYAHYWRNSLCVSVSESLLKV